MEEYVKDPPTNPIITPYSEYICISIDMRVGIMMKMMMMIVLFECAIIQNEKERALRSIAQTFVRRAIRRSERQRDNASNLTPPALATH